MQDPTNGARMTAQSILVNQACSIQMGRDRNTGSSAFPAGVTTITRDPIPAWKMIYPHQNVRILKNDTVTDDIGRVFLVGGVYETPLTDVLYLNVVTP